MEQKQSRVIQDRKFSSVYKHDRERIGKGRISNVFRCNKIDESANKKDFAVKILIKDRLKRTPQRKKELDNEITMLLNLDHPHILKMYEVFETNKAFYLVMEHLVWEPMPDRIQSQNFFSEYNAAFATIQIVDALIYCHEKGICHRNLKPKNLIHRDKKVKNSEVVIAGFRIAKNTSGELML